MCWFIGVVNISLVVCRLKLCSVVLVMNSVIRKMLNMVSIDISFIVIIGVLC